MVDAVAVSFYTSKSQTIGGVEAIAHGKKDNLSKGGTAMKYIKLVAVVALVAIAAILASACGGGGDSETTTPPTPIPASEISKPRPEVTGVVATTAGLFEDYYAILDITIRNKEADGVVIVMGSITQGGVTTKSSMPLYLAKGAEQTVKLVFPLKWKGGEWIPSVETEVP